MPVNHIRSKEVTVQYPWKELTVLIPPRITYMLRTTYERGSFALLQSYPDSPRRINITTSTRLEECLRLSVEVLMLTLMLMLIRSST